MARHGIRTLFRATSVGVFMALTAAAVALEPGADDPLAWGQENLDAGRYREAIGFFRKAADNDSSPAGARAALRLAGALRLVGE
jgi:hypothetical protein